MISVLDSDIAQAGGWTTVSLSLFLTVSEWIGHFEINDILQGVASVGALVFLWYKIKMIRLDIKIKKENFKKKKDA